MRHYHGNMPKEGDYVVFVELKDLQDHTWGLCLMKPITDEGWCNMKLVWGELEPRPYKANYWISYNIKKRHWPPHRQAQTLRDDPDLGPDMARQIEEQCRAWTRDLADQPEPSFEDLL